MSDFYEYISYKKGQIDKPGSVICYHLSYVILSDDIMRPTREKASNLSLFGLASDKVYLALPVAREPVGSYSTFSPLPHYLLG